MTRCTFVNPHKMQKGWLEGITQLRGSQSEFAAEPGFLIFFFNLVYFWLCWVFVATRGLAVSGGTGFSLQWLLLLWGLGSVIMT